VNQKNFDIALICLTSATLKKEEHHIKHIMSRSVKTIFDLIIATVNYIEHKLYNKEIKNEIVIGRQTSV